MTADRYASAESFHKLAMAYAPVPDLHIMWLLHLCDAHQEMQSWAEAAQCAVAVAGVIMQVDMLAGHEIQMDRDLFVLFVLLLSKIPSFCRLSLGGTMPSGAGTTWPPCGRYAPWSVTPLLPRRLLPR